MNATQDIPNFPAPTLPTHRLHLNAPIDRWDEAIPLGNGLMGGLLYGNHQTLRLSLDRGDLWDLRDAPATLADGFDMPTMVRLVREGKHQEVRDRFESYYWDPTPTKIPAGRLLIDLPAGSQVDCFELDLAEAIGHARLSDGAVSVCYHALEPVVLLHLTGSAAKGTLRLQAPDFTRRDRPPVQAKFGAPLWMLDYPEATSGQETLADGLLQWTGQPTVNGFAYAMALATRHTPQGLVAVLAITTTHDDPDPLALACRRVTQTLGENQTMLQESHHTWWRDFWSQSAVALPDPAIEQYYHLARYFYGAASRLGAPPMPLQGIWTADEDAIPPWKGDYHHDLNTQMCYWAYLPAGHFDEGRSFLDFLWELLPQAQRFARDFYKTPGAIYASVMSLTGQVMGGWVQYTYGPTHSAWLGQLFDLHWRYTGDRTFLETRAYPFCAEVATAIEAWLEEDANGFLKLPLSSCPEVHDNQPEAWVTPNSHYDLSLMRWLFGAVAEMADELSLSDQAQRWRSVLAKLEPLAITPWRQADGSMAPAGPLMVSADEALTQSHRHFSHLMAIHPLGLIHVEGSDHDRQVIDNSLRQLDELGPGMWTGFSYAWLAVMAARVGQDEKALHMLEMFLKGFVSRNGFHLNGDYKNLGLSRLKYRPFTLEANFAAAQCVHEMLLQSWGGVVRLFPAVSQRWQDIAFTNLRAEGGWRISAVRKDGQSVRVRIEAAQDGVLRLADPFAGNAPQWQGKQPQRHDNVYEIALKRGEVLTGVCPG